jgi:hypothetical protein
VDMIAEAQTVESLGRRRAIEEGENHDLSIRMRPVAVRQLASIRSFPLVRDLADRDGHSWFLAFPLFLTIR